VIIVQTPFRVSFVGGGTDFKSYYQEQGGAVVSSAIDKYIYVTVKPQNTLFETRFRISYSITENVDSIEQIEHPIVREALRLLEIKDPLEIAVLSEIPARTGMGSSSSFTVGLLNALHASKGEYVTPEQLACEACHVEIDILQRPIGKQDHYAASYGGLNRIQFDKDESVKVEPALCSLESRRQLFDHFMIFYTGITRDAETVLQQQEDNVEDNRSRLEKMAEMVAPFFALVNSGAAIADVGRLLHEGWLQKQQLAKAVSSSQINSYYESALAAGALGGKILGAGGGGFLLLCVEEERRDAVRESLAELMEFPVNYEPYGSRIIFVR